MIKQKHFIYLVLIAAAIVALFLFNPLLLYFQNDDMVHIPLSRDGVLFQHNSFRPICDISMMIDYKLYGKHAWGYHLTNLIIHTINSILVFVAMKLFIKKYLSVIEVNLIAFTTAVLFWIYMNHSEAVFWILGRSAMLGMLFFLSAVVFYFYRKAGSNFLFSIIFCLLAWLSYESTLILPAVFFIISFSDVKSKKSSWKNEWKFIVTVLFAFIIYCCCRFYFMGTAANYYNSGNGNNISVSFIIGSFFRLMIRSWLPPSQNKIFLIIAVIVLILIATVLTKIQNKKNRDTIVALIIVWCISLLPYLALSMDTKGVESERFLYLPSLFICMIISIFFIQMKSWMQISFAVIICLINLVVLSYHAAQYRFAGRVVATTINAINSLKAKKILYADNIPQENFGALIFRSGFIEGINWLKNNGTIDSVVVLSQSHNDLHLQKKYKVLFSTNTLLINDSIKARFTSNDLYFLYTDSALTIIR